MDAGAAKVELEVGKLTNEIESLKRERLEASDYVDKIRQILPTLDQMSSSQQDEDNSARGAGGFAPSEGCRI